MWRLLLDLIFPPFCVGCGWLGQLLCGNCYEQIEFFAQPITIDLEPCYLDQVWAMAEYQFPLDALLHALKYQSVKDVGTLLAQMMYYTMNLPITQAITAVPLHHRRLNERGFNQAEVIARHLATLTHRPYLPLLTRTYDTTAQAQVQNRTERLSHLTDAFALSSKTLLEQTTTIVLVDDVTTTGSTLNECAKILKQAGWEKVYGIVAAHGG